MRKHIILIDLGFQLPTKSVLGLKSSYRHSASVGVNHAIISKQEQRAQ